MSAPEPWSAYPRAAEEFWVSRAEAATGLGGDEALERLGPSVSRLSDLFTTERPSSGFPDYFAEAELLAAYGVFFLPQSFIRTSFALAHAWDLRGWRPGSARPSILDLGSGPGSCGVAVAHRLIGRGVEAVDLCGVDKSPSALVGFEDFADAVLGDKAAVRTRVGDAARPDTWGTGGFDLIVAGFVMNEMTQLDARGLAAWMQEVLRRLAPGGLLLILEPALRVTAERLQRLSDETAAAGFRRIGSDLDSHACPQLLAGEHWNHEARPWDAPSSAAFVNRRLHRDLREVRFAFAAFTESALPALPAGAVRLVSDVQIIKGLLRFIVVREGALETVEVPTRGLTKHEVKKMAARFGRGDVVGYDHTPAHKLRLSGPDELRVIWSPN